MKKLLCAACLAFIPPAFAVNNFPAHAYNTGTKLVLQLGSELYETLPSASRQRLQPMPLSVESLNTPLISPVGGSDEGKPQFQVCVSVGFIDLINHLAHAKAIDRIQPGYFDKYVLNLARDGTNEAALTLPGMVDPRDWTDDVMNDQSSYFNQMIGMIVAINLSHYYLGHFEKYSARMLAGKLVPINNFLSPAEWEAGLKAGTLNSLDCAIRTDGMAALFEAIDKLPQRPAWMAFIVPENADLKKAGRELAQYETEYFRGQLK